MTAISNCYQQYFQNAHRLFITKKSIFLKIDRINKILNEKFTKRAHEPSPLSALPPELISLVLDPLSDKELLVLRLVSKRVGAFARELLIKRSTADSKGLKLQPTYLIETKLKHIPASAAREQIANEIRTIRTAIQEYQLENEQNKALFTQADILTREELQRIPFQLNTPVGSSSREGTG